MIATVTFNPCLDRNILVHGLVIDDANRWTSTRLYPGGKGVDVSRAIHEMGGRTIAYGFVGGPDGQILEILLDEEGVPFSFTPIEQETRTNFIIYDSKTSQQTRIDAPGPHITTRELERFKRKMKDIYPRPKLLVAGGSLPPGLADDIYAELIQDARSFGLKTILDTEGQWLEEGIKARPYLVKPNVREAKGLLKRELGTEEDIIKGVLDIVAMGVEIAVISRGADGIIAASREKIVKAVSPPLKVRSAVGAGDCTIAGLALRLARGQSLGEACRLAVAMGGATVITPGTELCHRDDVKALLPQIKVSQMSTKEKLKVFSVAK